MADRLDKLVVGMARVAARVLVEKTLAGEVRAASVEHAFDVLWPEVILKQIRQMVASNELDQRRLDDERRFRPLAQLAFLEECMLLAALARQARERVAAAWSSVPGRAAVQRTPVELDTTRALAYDPGRRRVVYLARRGDATLGPLWVREGHGWRAVPGSTVELPSGPERMTSVPYTQLSLVTDPSRGGLVAWTFTSPELHRSFPVAIRFDGASPSVELHEAAPRVGKDDVAAFAYDATRGVTVLVTARQIWELDALGTWRCAAHDLDDLARPFLDQSHERHLELQVLPDPAQRRVVILARARGHMTTLSWDGKVRRLLTRHVMRDERGGFGIAVWSQSDGVRAYVAGSIRGLGEHDWGPAVPAVAASGSRAPDGNAPLRDFLGVAAAYDPVERALVLGPGSWNRGPHQHVFFVAQAGAWSTLEPMPHSGIAQAPST